MRSPTGQGAFKGSTSIRPETDLRLVLETCQAAQAMGFDRVVLCNAHLEPDNIQTLRAVEKRYLEAEGVPLLFPDKTRRRNAERLTEEFRSGSCHAGQYETSLVLAIAPQLVRWEQASALPEHHIPLHERIQAGAKDFLECGLDRAYCGNPAGATAEEGRQSLEVLSDMVLELVQNELPLSP